MTKESRTKSNITKDSVYEEIRGKGHNGKKIQANERKLPYAQELVGEKKIEKVGSKYYTPEFAPSPEMVYRKIKEAGKDGITLKKPETDLTKALIHEGKVKIVDKKYYASEFVLEIVYRKIKEAGKDGITLKKPETDLAQALILEGKIKEIGGKKETKKYYLPEFAPLSKEQAISHFLDTGYLRKSGKNYFLVRRPLPDSQEPAKLPSFSEFVETLQKIYLRKTGGYKQSTSILPLLEELESKIGISEALAKKWILEMPKIFIGIVDLRPFPGEPGLTLENGREVSRIYLERGIVGL